MPDQKDLKKSEKTVDPRTAALVNNGVMPILAVFTGLVLGAVIIAVSDQAAIAAWGHFFQAPGTALAASWKAIVVAYTALFQGALGTPGAIIAGFETYFATGQPAELYKAIYPLT